MNSHHTYWMPYSWHQVVPTDLVMAFATTNPLYPPDDVEAIRREQAELASVLLAFGQRVVMLVNPDDKATATKYLDADVVVAEVEHDSIWVGDTLPPLIFEDLKTVIALNGNFDGWGNKLGEFYPRDKSLAQRFCDACGVQTVSMDIVAERGAYEPDGQGTLLATAECLLRSRNPEITKEVVEANLKLYTGGAKVIWLNGSVSFADEITGGHTGNVAFFAKPRVVVVMTSDDPDDPDKELLDENLGRLRCESDANGDDLDVVELSKPRRDRMPQRGGYFSDSYINFLQMKKGIIMPRFGDRERDDEAMERVAGILPGRRVVQLGLDTIFEYGGGLRCVVIEMPRLMQWNSV